MAEGLVKKLTSENFDPEAYVNTLSEGGEDELLDTKKKIQQIADETSQTLKRNVFKNYSQFIETAKEISILEGEMYQLSHMLTEQKANMSLLQEMSLTGDQVDNEEDPQSQQKAEEDCRNNLAFLLEKVEGCASITDVPGRHLVHDGDLIELDPESLQVLQRIHMYLLNDSVMLASWLPNRRGPVRYRFQALYELDSLAVVNARDIGNVRHAFKILMFPDCRLYQTDSPKAKRKWLDILESTKKKRASHDTLKSSKSSSLVLTDHSNPFNEVVNSNPFDEESVSSSSNQPVVPSDLDVTEIDWLQELPEDLDVSIAQRDFEGAVDLIERAVEYLSDFKKTPTVKEFRAKIDNRVRQLTDVLVHELQVAPERSLRGGPRAARRAVAQLIRLGKSSQACNLFLKNRSGIIKYNMKQLKMEGATSQYVRRLCEMFFDTLMNTGKEFLKAFPDHHGCYSAFVVWAKQELQTFVGIFGRQLFGAKTKLNTIAECVHLARKKCDQLSDIGLELTFLLDEALYPSVEQKISDSTKILMEAIKQRGVDDMWRVSNFQNRVTLNRFLDEMAEIGIKGLESLVYKTCILDLTSNTTQFSKAYFTFATDVVKLYSDSTHHLVVNSLVDLFSAQLKHIENSLQSVKFIKDHQFILRNANYLLGVLLTRVEDKVIDYIGHSFPELDALHDERYKLKGIAQAAKGEVV